MRYRVLAFLVAAGSTASACGGSPPPDVPIVPATEPALVVGSGGSVPVARAAPEPAGPVSLPAALRAHLRAQASAIDSRDAALFRKAAEREDADDPNGARGAYYELIRDTPSSPLVPYAYLAFADFFFRDAENGAADRWPLAQQAYHEVIKYPPPKNLAYAYALQRLGDSFNRTKEFQRALDSSRKAIQAVALHKGLALGPETAEAARRDLVIAYAGVGSPDKALVFFRNTDVENTPSLMLGLGEQYVQAGAAREAVALYVTALDAGKSNALCAAVEDASRTLGTNADAQTKSLLAKLDTHRKQACGP